MMTPAIRNRIHTSTLDIAYEESGPANGAPALLMHGWPYDPRTYDDVVPQLTGAGCRVLVPYRRGFGATRFLAADTPRSSQQAALDIEHAVLADYDWDGRAACVVTALWPERGRKDEP